MAETQEKRNPLQDFTAHLVKSIEENKAPWQKPWKAGELIYPFNGKTQRHYNGFNNVQLLDLDYNDPRWMTYKQANELGLQIKRGSKSTKIRFCDFTATLPVEDENGNQVLDADGKPQMEKYLTTSPKVIIYNVFNATQIEGLESYVRQEPDWNPAQRAEKLLAALGEHASLEHNRRDAAHLSSLTKIEMPARSSFASAGEYYATALHEYSHWVAYQGKTAGEVQALQADYKTPEGRAKEEMIADITSMLLARDLHLDYNPQNNIAYIASWSKMLKDTPFELYRITAEAERRKGQLLEFELEKRQEQAQAAGLGEENGVLREGLLKLNLTAPTSPELTAALSALSDQELTLVQRWDAIRHRDDAIYDDLRRADRDFDIAIAVVYGEQVFDDSEQAVKLHSALENKELIHIENEYLRSERDKYVQIKEKYYAYENEAKSIKDSLGDKLENYITAMGAKRQKNENIQIAYDQFSRELGCYFDGIVGGSKSSVEEALLDLKKITPELVAELAKTSSVYGKEADELIKRIAIQGITPQLAEIKTILSVPYKDKDQAKKLGASWDKENKVWFVPVGTDLTAFGKWMPRKEVLLGAEAPGLSAAGELALAIRDLGGDLQGKMPVMDSKIHRLSVLNRAAGNKDFAYCAYNDAFPAGWLHNHANNQKVNWRYSGHQLTDEQKAELKAEAAIQRQARSNERKVEHDKAAEKYSAYFQERSPAHSDHPYLVAKGIEPDGLNVTADGAALIVPLFNTQGQIRSLQYINEDGSKALASGAEKSGNFGLIGCAITDLAKQQQLLIAEGYATAKSLNTATGLPVVMSVDIGNMASVAKNIRSLLPEADLTICADNDHSHKLPNGKSYNIGTDKGKVAADLVQGRLAIPYLTPADKANGLKDFNDIHKTHGLDALKKQMDVSLNNTKIRQAEAALSR